MSIRAKFRVDSFESILMNGVIDPAKPWSPENSKKVEMRTIILNPVYSNDPASENAKFWKASPSGQIKLGTINPEAWKQFELSGEYYIDFTKAD